MQGLSEMQECKNAEMHEGKERRNADENTRVFLEQYRSR